MHPNIYKRCKYSAFNINHDLVPLLDMIKAFSLKLSTKARQRLEWMDMYRECGNAKQVCRHFSISPRTFWFWKRRYDPWDLKSLEDKSKKPKRSPRQTDWDIEQKVLKIKREHPRWGKEKIGLYLRKQGIEISGKTCYTIIKRNSLIVKYKTRKRKPVKPRVKWAKVGLPGDLLEMDVKYIRLDNRRVYQYTLIDVVSRWRYIQAYHFSNMKNTIKFIQEAKTKTNIKFKMIQTDNGSEFGKLVSNYLQQNKIKHVFAHKGRPTENGHVERSHRTDEEEFYSLGGYGNTIQELRDNLSQYLQMYNTKRPHWGLKGLTPMEALQTYSLTKVCKMS